MAKKYDIKTNKYGVGAATSVLWLSRAEVAACVLVTWYDQCRVKHGRGGYRYLRLDIHREQRHASAQEAVLKFLLAPMYSNAVLLRVLHRSKLGRTRRPGEPYCTCLWCPAACGARLPATQCDQFPAEQVGITCTHRKGNADNGV